jgi:hypothetical protein
MHDMTATHALLEHTATDDQLEARKELMRLYEASPLPVEDALFNLGLWARSGLLVKFLVMHELYKRFVNIPGLIVEVGTWYGQNLVLLENLRAIHEPFNKQRKILGFDSFTGYKGKPGFYDTGLEYKDYLARLLKTHQQMNVYGHQDISHELVVGDVMDTAPKYFREHDEAIVAFAYFDIGEYGATEYALHAIKPHLVPGSVLLLDQLTWAEEPGEAVAFRQVFGQTGYKIEKSSLYPSKAIVTIV